MARFIYTVQDPQGATQNGVLDAASEEQAAATLQNKGYIILSIQSDKSTAKSAVKLFSGGGKVSNRDLIFFGEQLSTLLNGGVPLVRALSLLGDHAESKGLQHVVSQITKEVAAGGALYKALDKHQRVFSPIWVSLVQAGEMSGQLPRTLMQISEYEQAAEGLRSKIITALAYPAVLMFMSVGVLIFFVIRIVPVFANVFTSFDLELPPLTKIIILVSVGLTQHLLLILAAIAAVVFAFKGWVSTEAGRYTWNKITFKIPFVGNFVKAIQIERMLSTLATLIQSGVSILNAISVLEGIFFKNILILNALKAAKNDIAAGKSISASFRKTGVFPPLVTEMIWMGEESGKLPDILQTLSGFYKEQIDQFVRRFTAIIDPILVVGVGGIIGVIVMSIFMPIFQLSQVGMK